MYNLGIGTRGITGAWSMMGHGAWGAVPGEHGATTPVALDAYHLSTLYSPTYTVRAAITEVENHFSLTGPSQFIKLETVFPNQYFLLQPRGNVGYDRGFHYLFNDSWLAPHGGLLIYHIDEIMRPSAFFGNNIWQEHPFLDIEEAHGGIQHLQFDTPGNFGTPNDLFYGIKNRFDGTIDPNSNLYTSWTSGIQNIASNVYVSEITPNVTGQNTPGGRVNVTLNIGTGLAIPPTITTTLITDIRVGFEYSTTLAADGTAPITWAIASGNLPDGLSLNGNTGVISGMPTMAGSYSFTVRATNIAGYDTKDISIVIHPELPQTFPIITTYTLPVGFVNVFYTQTIIATSTTPISWSIPIGTLPDGLNLNGNTGVISGMPTRAGTYSFAVGATNISGIGVNDLSIVINPTPVITTITTLYLPGGIVGQSYNQTLNATGTVPITWSISSGRLPTGLVLNTATGVISGTPTAAGTLNFSVRATNIAGNTTKSLSIVIAAPPTITTTSLPGGIVGKSYNQRLIVTGKTPITWLISKGALPAGLSLNTGTGALTGIPTAIGTSDFTVVATNADGNATIDLSIVITAIPTVTTASLPGGIVGQPYSQTLTATGTTPMTWSISSRTLPAGLSLNETTGIISGTPTTAGTFNFTVRATNAAGNGTSNLSIVITAPPTITTTSLPGGTVGRNYNQTLKATGTTPITWSIASGTLPTGLNLNVSTGAITGVPTVAGTSSFMVRATNSAGNTTSTLSIVIN